MHRSCRIGGNKFNVYSFALAVVRTAVVLALCTDILENIGIVAVAEIEIDESRTCDFDTLEICAFKAYFGDNRIGNFSRSIFKLSCPCHCGIGREIAVRSVGRDLNIKCARRNGCKRALFGSLFRSAGYYFFKFVLNLVYYI